MQPHEVNTRWNRVSQRSFSNSKNQLHCSDDESELRFEAGHIGDIAEDDSQISGTFVVEAEVLRVRLGHEQLEVALVDEVAHRPCVDV